MTTWHQWSLLKILIRKNHPNNSLLHVGCLLSAPVKVIIAFLAELPLCLPEFTKIIGYFMSALKITPFPNHFFSSLFFGNIQDIYSSLRINPVLYSKENPDAFAYFCAKIGCPHSLYQQESMLVGFLIFHRKLTVLPLVDLNSKAYRSITNQHYRKLALQGFLQKMNFKWSAMQIFLAPDKRVI